MSDLVHDAQQEFWRPPVNQSVVSGMAEACRRCGTEFMVGAAFCHICGMGRHRAHSSPAVNWIRHFDVLRTLEFSNIKRWFGLPRRSPCRIPAWRRILAGCRSVGFVNSDFEAIQLWRIQWLMAACAAFLAGILLKSRKTEN